MVRALPKARYTAEVRTFGETMQRVFAERQRRPEPAVAAA